MDVRRPSLAPIAVVAAVGTVTAGGIALLIARSDVLDMPGLNAAVRSGLVLVACVCAIAARSVRPASRIWVVFLVVGAAFATTALQAFAPPALYTIGRLMLPVSVVLLLYAFLAFPTGRIAQPESRLAFGAAAAAMGAAWLFTALVGDPLPSSGLLSTCDGACPGNPFAIGSGSPGLVEPAALALALAQVVAAAGVAAALAIRLRGLPPVERVTLEPVLAPLAVLALTYAASALLRAIGADAAVDTIGWTFTPLFVAIALALLIGQLRGRMFAGTALRRTLSRLGPHPDPAAVERRMAAAFGDPSLRIAYRATDGGYVDSSGRPTDVPAEPGPGVGELWDGGERVAVVLSDHRLDAASGFVEAASAATVLALRNARLSAELRSSVRALRASRARISSAVDGARRQLERELAEGAQLQLTIVRARLADAASRVDEPAPHALLADLGTAAEAAASTLAEAAHGIYPRKLAEHGPAAALRARLGSVPAIVVLGHAGRGPEESEAAIFFTCLEAAQNSLKHAGDGSRVTVTLHEYDDRLRFEVVDDGAGFDVQAVREGHGLTHIRDRIEAVGGQVSIVSSPGRGASVTGDVPWGRPSSPAAAPSGARGHGTTPSTRQLRSSSP